MCWVFAESWMMHQRESHAVRTLELLRATVRSIQTQPNSSSVRCWGTPCLRADG